MSEPSVATFRVLVDHQEITALDDDRIEAAVAAHLGFRPDLLALRARPLPFLGAVPEPADALAWLERGGEPV